ncbi:MAG: serine acetyltransferase [Bacteroidota bacterium]
MVKSDFMRRYNLSQGGVLRKLLTCYRSPGLHAVIIFRFGHWLLHQSLPVKFLLKIFYVYLNHRMMAKWGIQIDVETKIGEGFLIFHYGGIFVGSEAVIGNNVSISHNVTIGLSGEGRRRGAPVIGNNVYIAPGANVSGKIRVGNNARIGANAMVNKDVPDNALVQAPPMQVVVFPSLYAEKDSVPRHGG